MNNNDKKLYIVDGHSMIYRAYYAFIRRPLINTKGMNTSAIYGFLRMLFRLLKFFSPQYLIISFDTGKPNFRHKMFEQYKETRKKMPDDLIVQLPVLKKLVQLLGIPQIEVEGYESDDIIGKIATEYANKGFKIYIISKDKDLLQLINDNIYMLQPETTKAREEFVLIDKNKVKEKYKIPPENIIDYLALTGDTSDNIPGVQGIGPVAAAELIQKFHTIENLYQNIDKVESEKIREKLIANKDNAFLSKKLVRLALDANLNLTPDYFRIKSPNKDEVLKIFDELEIKTLLKELDWLEKISSEDIQKEYTLIDNEAEFEKLIEKLKNIKKFALDTETDDIQPVKAGLVGISIAIDKHKAYYIPVGHSQLITNKQLSRKYVIEKLKPVLESENTQLIGQNIKYDYIVFKREGIEIKNIYFDTMLASYLLNPTKTRHNLDELALHFLGYKMISYKELLGKEYKNKTFADVPVEKAAEYSCEDSDITFQIYTILEQKLNEMNLKELYYKIDIPLIRVLAEMEIAGVKIDVDRLRRLDSIITERLTELTSRIYEEAGEMFNINSPKQLSEILFVKLKLPSFRKGRTGNSTDVEVLKQLKKHHPIAELLLEYRTLNKLKTTYIDVLPKMINPSTGRIHTSFSQTTTATGRLASSDPNLQNIPVRDEYGKQIREAFVPEEGNLILSADYSQIELRILAHIAEDEVLIDAFKNNQDIHNRTVMEIYGVPEDKVTPELRRMAKVINYGVAYGMSAYGLAQELEIDVKEADAFINKYFERYKGIKNYIERIKKEIESKGYVENLFGRRRYLPDMKSASRQQKSFILRTAINTPVQGSAADLIKIAMIEIHNAFKKEKLKSQMILQVHDELVFEVVPKEKDKVYDIIKSKMENATKLKVPLVVDINFGKNWAEAH